MKHHIPLITGLALMGCDEQVKETRNETDLRALTVDLGVGETSLLAAVVARQARHRALHRDLVRVQVGPP